MGVVIVFGVLFVMVVLVYYWMSVLCMLLFWLVFILICFLGVVVGDFLDKLISLGGFVLSCYLVLVVLLLFILVVLFIYK